MAPNKSLLERIALRARKHPLGHRFTAVLGHDLVPKRWIFVIGCYNSGTTLLDAILARHPRIRGLPCEGVALTDSLARPEEHGWTRMWCKCKDDLRAESGNGMEKRARRIKRQWSVSYPRNAENLVEKSIANALRMPFLQAYFRPAYFIYIVRNGYAVANGIQRRAQPWNWNNPEFESRYPIELCAQQWRISDDVVENDRPKIERFLAIRYEDLTGAPHKTAREITGFLGLPPFPKNALDGRWSVQKYNAPIQNMNGSSIQSLTVADARKIESEARRTLQKYGYEFPFS